jgi:hypothetical protein
MRATTTIAIHGELASSLHERSLRRFEEPLTLISIAALLDEKMFEGEPNQLTTRLKTARRARKDRLIDRRTAAPDRSEIVKRSVRTGGLQPAFFVGFWYQARHAIPKQSIVQGRSNIVQVAFHRFVKGSIGRLSARFAFKLVEVPRVVAPIVGQSTLIELWKPC